VVTGEQPDEQDERVEERLDSRELLAVNTLGQLAKNPRVGALRRFITGWYLSYLTADNTRGIPEAGPQERLSTTGDNLPNVIQHLKEQYPDRLKEILLALTRRVPRLEKVDAEVLADGRLMLQVKDAPFQKPVMAKFASDGTLKMLAYLTLLYDPEPPQLIGIEEPENQLHPRLLPELAEECRRAADSSQLLVTTHSPFFLNALQPKEVWVLYRDEKGYTQARRAADMRGVGGFMEHGAKLGHLWMEGQFEVGDPLVNAGAPRRPVIRFKRTAQ
jgi:predicted ATPase